MSAAQTHSHSILFLDDEEKILEILAEVFVQWGKGKWQVHTAQTTARALTLLQENKIDLVVVDIHMPVVDGLQFLQLLNRKHPSLAKVALTGDATEVKRADALKSGAELFLEKPRSAEGWESLYATLTELVSWQQQPQEGFRGVLRQVGLPDVIQMECLSRNSCILEVSNRTAKGRVFIHNGSIVHAEMGNLSGQDAFNAVLSLSGGDFNLQPFTAPPQATISGQWEFLLMEAARLRDEQATNPGGPPAPEAAPVSAADLLASMPDLFQARPAEVEPPAPDAAPTVAEAPAQAPTDLSSIPDIFTLRPAGAKAESDAPPVDAASKSAPDPVMPTETETAKPAAPPDAPHISTRVDEIVICSGKGDVLYEWHCQALELRLKLFEFVSTRAAGLADSFPLGSFDRLEILGPHGRIITQLQADKRLLVRTTPILSA